MAEIIISTLATCIIKPSTPSRAQHMFLPSADFPFRWVRYHRGVLFFKLPLDSCDSFIARLKSSLAMALVDFFPWAGRLFEQEDSGRLALDSNDAGVPFIEAYIDTAFSTLEEDRFKTKTLFDGLAPHGDVVYWTGPDLPLLSIQLTRFAAAENTAGFALGFGHCHAVADGCSLWHFMKSWGEHARGVSISVLPVHMREELHAEKLILPSPAADGRQHGEEQSTDPLRSTLPQPAESAPRATPQPPAQSATSDMEELAERDFYFSSEMVRRLKQMAVESMPAATSLRPISSLQALAAHMWRHIATAADRGAECKSAMRVVANMRSRLVPPLPQGYFGNAVASHYSVTTREHLLEESLGATALRIQHIIETMDNKFAKSLYGKAEVLPLHKVFANTDPGITLKVQVSGSPRFPVYEVDFGWGPPVWATCPSVRAPGYMMWYPGPDGEGSVLVSLALAKPVMENLEHMESLLCF